MKNNNYKDKAKKKLEYINKRISKKVDIKTMSSVYPYNKVVILDGAKSVYSSGKKKQFRTWKDVDTYLEGIINAKNLKMRK